MIVRLQNNIIRQLKNLIFINLININLFIRID